jgi:hypothetical protein
MTYQVRIAESIGPLMSLALGGPAVTRLPACTRLRIVSSEPLDVACLARRLLAQGSVIQLIRVQRITGGPPARLPDRGEARSRAIARQFPA